MWPSTSWWMRAGSHVGIWLEIAVTMPNANEAKPRRRRMRRSRRSRSLRILLRRPFDASPLRLRPNKRPILTPNPGPQAVLTMTKGMCCGAGTPPAFSCVTITVAPGGTGWSSGTPVTSRPASNVPAGRGPDGQGNRGRDRDDGGCRSRERPPRPQRDDIRTLGAGGCEDPLAKLRRRRRRVDGVREGRRPLGEGHELLAAALAAREVRL